MRRLNSTYRRYGFLSLSAALFCPLFGNASPQKTFEKRRETVGHWRIQPELSMLSTTENYDGTGRAAKVTGLNSYSKQNLDIYTVYGYSPRLSLYGRVSLTRINFTTTGSPGFNGAGIGFSDQAIGMNYRAFQSTGSFRYAIDVQSQLDIPTYSSKTLRSSEPPPPIPGDGTLDFTVGSFFTTPLPYKMPGDQLLAVAGLALQARTKGYSHNIPYQLGVQYIPRKEGFNGQFSFQGAKALRSDSSAVPTLETGAVARDAGGSTIVTALNSSYLNARLQVGYQWSPLGSFYGGYSMPLSGKSTSKMSQVYMGLVYRFGETSKPARIQSVTRSTIQTTTPPSSTRILPIVEYDLNAVVKQTNERINLIRIDQGSGKGIQVNDTFEIFRTENGAAVGEPIATGKVAKLGVTEAILRVTRYTQEVWIQPGYTAKRKVKRQ